MIWIIIPKKAGIAKLVAVEINNATRPPVKWNDRILELTLAPTKVGISGADKERTRTTEACFSPSATSYRWMSYSTKTGEIESFLSSLERSGIYSDHERSKKMRWTVTFVNGDQPLAATHDNYWKADLSWDKSKKEESERKWKTSISWRLRKRRCSGDWRYFHFSMQGNEWSAKSWVGIKSKTVYLLWRRLRQWWESTEHNLWIVLAYSLPFGNEVAMRRHQRWSISRRIQQIYPQSSTLDCNRRPLLLNTALLDKTTPLSDEKQEGIHITDLPWREWRNKSDQLW